MLNEANWKERDKLQRGQFVTTIAEMQQAMSYKVGYRTETPTKDEIRSAYETFTKATMITTTKTTRGMVVTILKYSEYQNKKNYEAHTEPHDEKGMKPETAPHDTEVIEHKNNKNPSASFDAEPKTEPPFYLSAKKRKLTGERLEAFNRFMDVFGDKRGRAQAADSWINIKPLTHSMFEKILEAAKVYSSIRSQMIADGKTPKMAQGWLSDKRWEDEAPKPLATTTPIQSAMGTPEQLAMVARLKERQNATA